MTQGICSINAKSEFAQMAIKSRPFKFLRPFKTDPPTSKRVPYMEKRAIEWLIRNEKGLTDFFTGMYGPHSSEIRDLRKIISKHKSEPDRTIMKWDNIENRFVTRHPYYAVLSEDGGSVVGLRPHPWHYVLFSQFFWYRWIIGGVWHNLQGVSWVRMQDWSKEEFCDDHAEMQPCEVCTMIGDI